MKIKNLKLIITFMFGLLEFNKRNVSIKKRAQNNDWTMWGGTTERNMVSNERCIADDFNPGNFKPDSLEVDMETTENIKWVATLGNLEYVIVGFSPSISNGSVLIGTNNVNPRDKDKKGDRGIVMCFNEKTGELEWQLVVPLLGAGKVSNWEFTGIQSTPAIEGDKVYVVTNRCEVFCLDIRGLKNGNNKPFIDDTEFETNKKIDADIIWTYDMRDKLGVFPHNITSTSPLIVKNMVIVATSNGIDWSHTKIPSPHAPGWIALNKDTGKLIGEDGSRSSRNDPHGNWTSLAYSNIDNKDYLIFGGPDGFCYGYDMTITKDSDGYDIFEPIWKVDCNPYRSTEIKNSRSGSDNQILGTPFIHHMKPWVNLYMSDLYNHILGTPVIYKNYVYITIGQHHECGYGKGCISCINIKNGKPIWKNQDIGRSVSTPSIKDDRLYIAEYEKYVHCYNAINGTKYWSYPTKGDIISSTLVVDGKVFIGDLSGDLTILEDSKEKINILKIIKMPKPICYTPVVANGTLYVGTTTHLYAIQKKKCN